MGSQVSVFSMLHRPGASDCHLPKWQKGFFQKGDQGWIVTYTLHSTMKLFVQWHSKKDWLNSQKALLELVFCTL